MAKLIGISGSLRRASHNTLLVQEAARLFAPTDFEMGSLDLPLYNGDLEDSHGVPEAVHALANGIAQADAVVISTPEYNKGIPGVVKNALDWLSRTKGAPLKDKPLAILSATSGISGGARAQYALRLALVPFQPHVLTGPEVLIGNGGQAFDADGRLVSDKSIGFLQDLMDGLRARVGD